MRLSECRATIVRGRLTATSRREGPETAKAIKSGKMRIRHKWLFGGSPNSESRQQAPESICEHQVEQLPRDYHRYGTSEEDGNIPDRELPGKDKMACPATAASTHSTAKCPHDSQQRPRSKTKDGNKSSDITLQRIPQPSPAPVVGNLSSIDLDDPSRSFMQLAARHGPIYRLSILGHDMVVLSSWKLVNEACDDERFQKSIKGELEELRNVVHDGLFTVRLISSTLLSRTSQTDLISVLTVNRRERRELGCSPPRSGFGVWSAGYSRHV